MILMLIAAGCQPQPAQPTPDVIDPELERLLADEALFPTSWYVDIAPQPWSWKYRERAETAAFVQFRQRGSRAHGLHNLYRYRNNTEAAAAYRRLLPDKFRSAEQMTPDQLTPWEVPDGLSYHSPSADEFQFGCAERRLFSTDGSDSFTICEALGLYGSYVSWFFTWVSSDGTPGMSLEELEPILKALDERMSSQAVNSR